MVHQKNNRALLGRTIDDDGFFSRRRRNRSAPRDATRTDAEEKRIKRSVHDVLKRYRGEYEACGVKLNVKFTYDGEVKRPNTDYDYTVTFAFLGRDEDDKYEIDIPLLRVIRGGKEYRPLSIKNAICEMDELLAEDLMSLRTKGYDEYFREA